MADLTLEQRRALAIAAARQRAEADAMVKEELAATEPKSTWQHIKGFLKEDAGRADAAFAHLTNAAAFRAGPKLQGYDEMAAVPRGGDKKAAYERGKARFKEKLAQTARRHPVSSTIGDVTGTILNAAALGRQGATAQNLFRPTTWRGVGGAAALDAGAYAGTEGYLSGEGSQKDRVLRGLEAAAKATPWGFALGAGLHGAVNAFAAGKRASARVPSRRALKVEGGRAIQNARDSGVTFSRRSFSDYVRDVVDTIEPDYSPKGHPQMKELLDDMVDVVRARNAPTVADLHDLRMRMNSLADVQKLNASQRRLIRIARTKLDRFMETNAPTTGLREGLKKWRRFKETELIDAVEEEARRKALVHRTTMDESGKRIRMEQLLSKELHPEKGSRGFSPDGIRALSRVVEGSGDLHNRLYRLAADSYLRGGMSGNVSRSLPGFIRGVAGIAAEPISAALTANNMAALNATLRAGRAVPSTVAAGPLERALVEASSRRATNTLEDYLRDIGALR